MSQLESKYPVETWIPMHNKVMRLAGGSSGPFVKTEEYYTLADRHRIEKLALAALEEKYTAAMRTIGTLRSQLDHSERRLRVELEKTNRCSIP
jgi:hypothetical protein